MLQTKYVPRRIISEAKKISDVVISNLHTFSSRNRKLQQICHARDQAKLREEDERNHSLYTQRSLEES